MQPLTHLAIRLSDKMYSIPSAIHRHIQVSCRHGAVWLPDKVRAPRTIVLCGAGDRCGKPDRGLPGSLVDRLNCQIAAGHPSFSSSSTRTPATGGCI
jgi:hypothetical protein